MSSRVPCRTRVLTEGFSVFFFSAAGERCHQLFCVVRQSVHPQWRRIQAGRATSGAPPIHPSAQSGGGGRTRKPTFSDISLVDLETNSELWGYLAVWDPIRPASKTAVSFPGGSRTHAPRTSPKKQQQPQTIHHSAVPPSSHPDQRPTKTHTRNTKKRKRKN